MRIGGVDSAEPPGSGGTGFAGAGAGSVLRPIDLPTAVDGELDGAKIIAAPDDPAAWPRWRERLAAWREEARARIDYSGSLYARPELAWTQSCFSVALVWLWDELLYDFEAERFTPERLLEEGRREFGGFVADKVLGRGTPEQHHNEIVRHIAFAAAQELCGRVDASACGAVFTIGTIDDRLLVHVRFKTGESIAPPAGL